MYANTRGRAGLFTTATVMNQQIIYKKFDAFIPQGTDTH